MSSRLVTENLAKYFGCLRSMQISCWSCFVCVCVCLCVIARARYRDWVGARLFLYGRSILPRHSCICVLVSVHCGAHLVHLQHVLSFCARVDLFAFPASVGRSAVSRYASGARHGCEQGVLCVCACSAGRLGFYLVVFQAISHCERDRRPEWSCICRRGCLAECTPSRACAS